jgi:hypothetical protein
MPALSRAISSSCRPGSRCDRATTLVMTATRGAARSCRRACRRRRLRSRRRRPRARERRRTRAPAASRSRSGGRARRRRCRSILAIISPVRSPKPSSEIGMPSTRARSVTLATRCGLVCSPVRLPARLQRAASIVAVEPLPLVPATCTVGYWRAAGCRAPPERDHPVEPVRHPARGVLVDQPEQVGLCALERHLRDTRSDAVCCTSRQQLERVRQDVGRLTASVSRTAFGLPGKFTISDAVRTPATARESIAPRFASRQRRGAHRFRDPRDLVVEHRAGRLRRAVARVRPVPPLVSTSRVRPSHSSISAACSAAASSGRITRSSSIAKRRRQRLAHRPGCIRRPVRRLAPGRRGR